MGVSGARRSLHVVVVRVALIFGFTWTGVSVVPSLTQVACRLTFMVICSFVNFHYNQIFGGVVYFECGGRVFGQGEC